MKRYVMTAVLSILATHVTLAQPAPPPVDEPRPVPVEVLAPIQTKVGELFTVTLDANPTTGYSWDFAKPIDGAILKLASSEFKRPDTKLMGAGGKQIWTFRAMDKGKTTITLKYFRPWEKDVTPVKVASVEVVIR